MINRIVLISLIKKNHIKIKVQTKNEKYKPPRFAPPPFTNGGGWDAAIQLEFSPMATPWGENSQMAKRSDALGKLKA
jgi:hypothetical protein